MTQDMLVVQAFMIPELSGSKCRYIQSFLQGLKSNALRLNEIFTQHFLYITALTYTRFGINRSCITSPNLKATTPLLGSQAFHGWCKRILSTEDITHFTSPTQNAMPQASICPEADYLVKKKSAVQYAVG